MKTLRWASVTKISVYKDDVVSELQSHINMSRLQKLHQQLAEIMIVVSRMLNDEHEMMEMLEVSRSKQQYLVI